MNPPTPVCCFHLRMLFSIFTGGGEKKRKLHLPKKHTWGRLGMSLLSCLPTFMPFHTAPESQCGRDQRLTSERLFQWQCYTDVIDLLLECHQGHIAGQHCGHADVTINPFTFFYRKTKNPTGLEKLNVLMVGTMLLYGTLTAITDCLLLIDFKELQQGCS